ncbi:MAG: hypothetical protein JXR91_08545 [Deltaproteobacteria bacterium]|nr:hypothetical protein [Deltaproteobacteria bacterium]
MSEIKLTTEHLDEILASKKKVIGFYGAPPVEALNEAAKKYPGVPFFDLDVYFNAPQTKILPDAFCHIIRNIVDNSFLLRSQMVSLVAATGEEKCDSGRYAASLLKNAGLKDVVFTVNHNKTVLNNPFLCVAKGSLKKRSIRIMESIIEPLTPEEIEAAKKNVCTPVAGFWGTPPHPIEVLDLFPDETHIYGWTRCVEMGVPADLQLEKTVPDNIPTIFFAQGFCAKSLIARELAAKHRGMYVDTHEGLNAAIRAKIEAFLRLSRNDREGII